MGDKPNPVCRVSVKTTPQLIVHPSKAHRTQRRDRHFKRVRISGAPIVLKKKTKHRGSRKLGRRTKPTMSGVILTRKGFKRVMESLFFWNFRSRWRSQCGSDAFRKLPRLRRHVLGLQRIDFYHPLQKCKKAHVGP